MRPRFTALATVVATVCALSVGAPAVSQAATPPVDIPGVPHYFGPYPNWANSPFTVSKADVVIQGAGQDASAQATVDPQTGGIQKIDVLAPGHGYVDGATTVTVNGGAVPATATAHVASTGIVVGATVGDPGTGYSGFDVTLTGGGGSGAKLTAFGGVDEVVVGNPGLGYTFPTLSFDIPSDPDGRIAEGKVNLNQDGSVQNVEITDPGSGYTTAPDVKILNGTQYDPQPLNDGGHEATATTTLKLTGMAVADPGSGYTSAPDVAIADVGNGSGSGATATATTDTGGIASITVDTPGSGYLTEGIKKFQDELPLPCQPPACSTDPDADYIPLAVPEAKSYNGTMADEYVIGLVQYRKKFNKDLPATMLRGYVQLETPDNQAISQHYPLTNELMNGTKVPILDPNGNQYLGVTPPKYLGPVIGATKDKPVRIVFHNLLPKGADGNLFMPTDSTIMGSGMGPMDMPEPVNENNVSDAVRNPRCTVNPQDPMCFKQDRATLHLHGGITPWISDGTPHQWITPSGEDTMWPEGVSVQNVPDMNVCQANDDGCQTFYYTNQQSARMMFYHDHAWGITRLNVYAGEAAGYFISDPKDKELVDSNTIPADQLPLIVQDRTFVPDDAQLALQDPTWDKAKWGTKGNFWYQHVYMPAQNPGDPSGMSAFGRWMYGPWFWPPAADTKYGPIPNPYYDENCNLDDPNTWQYDTDPFCEPKEIPGTPNLSVGMEQFNDTPVVNGVAYPKITLQPKSYRLRVLNAANDRFFNFQWYVADPTQGNGKTEVALNPQELAAAQTDPVVFPTPVQGPATAGPDWIQIGTEGGFLPAPQVVDGQQPTTWITDPTRFDVGNVDLHSLLLAPAERADAIVDFSKFAGKTLILYNDAPAAFPARVPSYDYYTGDPDLRPVGAPTTLPGYGPNTRTIMQVTIADNAPAGAFDLAKLRAAFGHKANGSGVFESSQHPIIVGQSTYNSAYGTSFSAASNCNSTGSTTSRCDGYVRVNDTQNFSFNTLKNPNTKTTMPLQPKAIHDEMNASTFDEFGRMQANLGVEAQPPTPGAQNVVLYPYVNPQTELIDGTNLPKGDVKVEPLSDPKDGSQLWRITHNGVDTHPIHFHLFDVQVVNRVTWDNIIIPPDKTELGWKDTVRVSPLEDTIVALRPIVPSIPFEIPNAIRELNPMMPDGSQMGFNNVDAQGNPTNPVVNQLVNFGWEYVYHCHILSHEEMDMMRPVSLVLPPRKATNLTLGAVDLNGQQRIQATWNDNSITETSFALQRSSNGGVDWTTVATSDSPLDQPNVHGVRTLVDPTSNVNDRYQYRVAALNLAGYGQEFMSMTARSLSDTTLWAVPPVVTGVAPSAGPTAGGTNITITGTGFGPGATVKIGGNAATNVVVTNSNQITATTPAGTAGAKDVVVTNTDNQSSTLAGGFTYVAAPSVPLNVTAGAQGPGAVKVMWDPPSSNGGSPITGYRAVARLTETGGGVVASCSTTGALTCTISGLNANTTYYIQVNASNAYATSGYTMPRVPVTTPPLGAPTVPRNLAVAVNGAGSVRATWIAPVSDGGAPITGYRVVARLTETGGSVYKSCSTNGALACTITGLTPGTTYWFQANATNAIGTSPYTLPRIPLLAQ